MSGPGAEGPAIPAMKIKRQWSLDRGPFRARDARVVFPIKYAL